MKKLISLIGFLFILNLSFAQSFSNWFSAENCSWIRNYSIQTTCQVKIKSVWKDVFFYKPNQKLFWIEDKYINGELQFRRCYLSKNNQISCN